MTLSDLDLDVAAARNRERTLIEQTAGLGPADLRPLTIEVYDRVEAIAAAVPDGVVAFVPDDPEADPDEGPGWTLGHVVVHLPAGLEENAAQACTLARGAGITGRPRHETPWEEVTTADQVRRRLAESRRMSLAFLDAWLDRPHLDNVHDHPFFGPMNAVAYHALGVNHAKGHLAQLAEIVRQATAARAANASRR